jgi:hypothetical protein
MAFVFGIGTDLHRISIRLHTEKNQDFFMYLNALFVGYGEEISEIPSKLILQAARNHEVNADLLMRQITKMVSFRYPINHLQMVYLFGGKIISTLV